MIVFPRGAMALAAFLGMAAAVSVRAEDQAWTALGAGGHVIFMRHTMTGADGDPLKLSLGDCAAERNLSEAGREQARRIGAMLRKRGVKIAQAFSSRYCRAAETARLAFGEAVPWAALDLSQALPAAEAEARAAEVLARAAAWRGPGILALVSHEPNIMLVTMEKLGPAEMAVLKPDGRGDLELVGRIAPP